MEQKYCRGCEEPVIDKIPGCPLQCRTPQCKAYMKKPVYDYEILPIVWVLGGPGSGKHAQCERIAKTYNFVHVSPGQMLRNEVEKETVRTKCLTSVMERGGLAPNDLVLELITKSIEAGAAKGARGFVINGFPREKKQGIEFERSVGKVSLILYLDASTETLYNTISQRRKDPKRVDETPCALKLRLETFMTNNEYVFELYRYRLVKINAELSPDEIFSQVTKAMNNLLSEVEARKAEKERLKALKEAEDEKYKLPESITNPKGSSKNP